jgi:hypothetical protein
MVKNDAGCRSGGDLSIHRSFLLRLYAEADPGTGEITGVVEHVVSGDAMEFRSVSELLNRMVLLLDRESGGTRR